MIPDWQDTAKFEARVAIVAANGAHPCLQDDCPYGHERLQSVQHLRYAMRIETCALVR